MGIASGMKEMAQDIASSHRDRAKRLGEIKDGAKQVRGAAQDLIKTFQSSRKELRTELKKASAAWQELTFAKAKKSKKQGKED